MKKIVLFALATAAICGTSVASAQEVTYVEDCSQGLLINNNKYNWFITAKGGANVLVSHNDVKADFKNRIGAEAGLYVGKWVTPNFGFRFGASWIMPKGATTADGLYRKENAAAISNGYYPEKFQGVGPEFDVLINLTNWWCGYKPNRVYNAVLHGGAGAYWTFARQYSGNDVKWRAAHNTFFFANVGLQNNFRVSNHVDLFVDLQWTGLCIDKDMEGLASLSAGITYNFGKTGWNCPVTAVCPTWKYTDAEGDALVARLNNADNKIKDLQRQLDDCLKRPVQKQTVTDCEGLATVYYPINQSTLSNREKNVLNSVAEVMKNNSDKNYVLTGWADNYTGTEEINARLRNARVEGVKDYLVKCGVSESQLETRTDSNNLTDFGAKAAPLSRAVTIQEAK
jgi:outer membrane protein OmpA-like peptidoglycan-associated protein